MIVGGQVFDATGTSASAPNIAGLLALKIALTRSRLGWENVDIHTRAHVQNAGSGAPFHHKGIPGINGYYATTVPYDLVETGASTGANFLARSRREPRIQNCSNIRLQKET